MRIAHVAPVVLPVPPETYGGTERVVADLALAQIRLGHEVSIFAGCDSTLKHVQIIGEFSSLDWHRRNSDRDIPAGLPAVLEAAQLADIVRHAKSFDVIHLHGSAHASGPLAALGVRPFRTVHWRVDEADHQEHFRAFPTERIVAISRNQARDIPRSSLAGVVHHGLPLGRYKLEYGDDGYLAFLGRMTDQKRPDRAVALAKQTDKPLKLAGPIDPGNPDYFAETLEPLLGLGIEHVGSVSDREKQKFLGKAAALVFPIDWPEPFGLVMIEAMACGTPVIAWRKGSVEEVVDDGVTGIIVEDVDEAFRRLPEVLSLDRSVVRATFERRFSMDRVAKEIETLYSEAGC